VEAGGIGRKGVYSCLRIIEFVIVAMHLMRCLQRKAICKIRIQFRTRCYTLHSTVLVHQYTLIVALLTCCPPTTVIEP